MAHINNSDSNSPGAYRTKAVVDSSGNLIELSCILVDYGSLRLSDSQNSKYSEVELKHDSAMSLINLTKDLTARQQGLSSSRSQISEEVLSPMKPPSRTLLLQKRPSIRWNINQDDQEDEGRCCYGRNVQDGDCRCGAEVMEGFPYCEHHLRVVANKHVQRRDLKRSRSSLEEDVVSYEGVIKKRADGSDIDEDEIRPTTPVYIQEVNGQLRVMGYAVGFPEEF